MDAAKAAELIEQYSHYEFPKAVKTSVAVEDREQPLKQVRDGVWYIVQTNIKCEKRAMADLEAAGINVFMPVGRKEIKHHRTKKWTQKEFPVFNRYMFIEMDRDHPRWFAVRRANGVESVLGVDGVPLPVDTHIVTDIKARQDVGAFDTMRQKTKRLQPGQRIRIDSGPLTGIYGSVSKASGRKTVHIIAEMLKNRIPVEIPLELISKG